MSEDNVPEAEESHLVHFAARWVTNHKYSILDPKDLDSVMSTVGEDAVSMESEMAYLILALSNQKINLELYSSHNGKLTRV